MPDNPLTLYNTLTRRKAPFTPIDVSAVRMYVCGPTVYDDAHIGNARPVIVFDVLFRLLRHIYGADAVTYARNVTDLDDKINLRAHERGITIRDLTNTTMEGFQRDAAALGCLAPTVEPRATDHIEDMKAIIERLIARGVAYVAEDHVLFHVPAMARVGGAPRYGDLARRPLDDMLAGARVDVAPYKRDPMDFVLWKPSLAAHEPGWVSPAGIAVKGRPGWHIECSAMAFRHLVSPFLGTLACDDPMDRETFDIHGGGVDLVFPHHQNELAQTCCASDTRSMARVWMHNGFLQVEGQKMSKSLGNFVTIRTLLDTDVFGGQAWHGDVLRLAMLRTHYRQPIDWTVKALEDARATLLNWYLEGDNYDTVPIAAPVLSALLDDLNTPAAIAALSQLGFGAGRMSALRFLGFSGNHDAIASYESRRTILPDMLAAFETTIETRIAERKAARAARDWALSDRIRNSLLEIDVVLTDHTDGRTSWAWRQKISQS